MNKQEFNAGKKAYQQPRMKVVEIDSSDIICTSPTGQSNEGYEDGNTDDWFNNIRWLFCSPCDGREVATCRHAYTL